MVLFVAKVIIKIPQYTLLLQFDVNTYAYFFSVFLKITLTWLLNLFIYDYWILNISILIFVYDHKVWTVHLDITTLLLGLPCPEPTSYTFLTTSFPSETLPKTVWRPSSHEVSAVVMKNWLPFVLGPAFAIERQNGSCCRLKFQSLNLGPQIDRPPVPSPLVKSPP